MAQKKTAPQPAAKAPPTVQPSPSGAVRPFRGSLMLIAVVFVCVIMLFSTYTQDPVSFSHMAETTRGGIMDAMKIGAGIIIAGFITLLGCVALVKLTVEQRLSGFVAMLGILADLVCFFGILMVGLNVEAGMSMMVFLIITTFIYGIIGLALSRKK